MEKRAGDDTRRIPMFVVLPPDTLLLDVAGPMEVFRRANLEQTAVRFDYAYVAASPEQTTSIGLTVSGLAPLPQDMPDDAWIVISGSLTAPATRERNRSALEEIVRWLRAGFRQGMTLVTICSGALLAGEAGLFDGFRCTTHAACMAELRRAHRWRSRSTTGSLSKTATASPAPASRQGSISRCISSAR